MMPRTATMPIDFSTEQAHSLVDFIPHTGTGPFQNWLGMNLPYAPFEKIKKTLEERFERPLIGRGEAHITVITPPEFDKVLSQKMNMDEINAIAKKAVIQKAKFFPVCIGQGTAQIDGKTEATWYMVVQSSDLTNIRNEIQKAFIQKGGKPEAFLAENYYPHVTLGFTKRDLHESDGVIKNSDTCKIAINSITP